MPIQFTTEPDNSPLGGLEQDQYSSASYQYPLDLSSNDPYMLLHFEAPTNSQYAVPNVNGSAPKAQPTINQNVLNDRQLGVASTITRPIKRVATTVVLPMPRLVDQLNISFTTADLGSGELFGGQQSWTDAIQSLGVSALKSAAKELGDARFHVRKGNWGISTSLNDLEINGLETASFLSQMAINNHTEQLFNGIGFRSFDMAFKLVPRTEEEAINIHNLTSFIRFAAVPEINASFGGGRLLIAPWEISPVLIAHGVENTAVPKISTCCLTNVTVDHAPTGEISFHRLGKDGTSTFPTVTMLSFTLVEMEVMQKQRILDGF